MLEAAIYHQSDAETKLSKLERDYSPAKRDAGPHLPKVANVNTIETFSPPTSRTLTKIQS